MQGGCGAFGKMPSLGDFFRIRAGADFVTVWDGWLQETMLSLRQTLGPRYEDCYMTAPVWRFALPSGIAGAASMIGVVMPSVDRVGRQFPLTLMVDLPLKPELSPFRNLFGHSTALDALEVLALDALDDTMTRDTLDARLAAIAPAVVPARGQVARAAWGGVVMQGGNPAMMATDLTDAVLKLGRAAVWACTVHGAGRFMTTQGLPRGPEALALFDLDASTWVEPVA